MWMMVWRPLVILVGLGGIGEAAGVIAVTSLNPAASNTVMVWVVAMMAVQAVCAFGCIAFAIWNPVARRLDPDHWRP